MKDGYVFYCSFCKFDHAGECVEKVCIGVDIDDQAPKKTKDILEGLDALIKALSTGNYNAAPSTLHQCKYDGSCGCGVRVDPDDPSVAIVSYRAVLPGTLRYIPLMFYLDGV